MEEDETDAKSASTDMEIDMSLFAFTKSPPQKYEESLESSHEDFFQEELVWPDPDNRFDKSSGIRPATLTSDLTQRASGMADTTRKTQCESAWVVRKRPRPKTIPWNILVIKSDPPVIEADEEDMEEFLVHDPLFVEYFNAFLSLPSFPEPIVFNLDTGGFEVVTDNKLKLARQIKNALRAQNLTAKMYRVVKQHAFSDIPVIPIEDVDGPEVVKIDTAFPVTTLNKDQGIYWVKAERLPLFLESDYYCQYRLAKIISQARVFNDKGEYIIMKLDYTSKSRTKKKKVEVPAPSLEDKIVKDLFVSFGDVKGAQKEQWFTEAKAALSTEPVFTSLTPRSSTTADCTTPAPAISTKPKEKSSVFHSHYFGVYSPGLIGPDQTEPPVTDENTVNQHIFSIERPFTPRPSDRTHAATSMMRARLSSDPAAEEEMIMPGGVAYFWPKSEVYFTDSESGFGDMDDKEETFNKKVTAQRIIDQLYNDGTWEEGGTGNIVLKTVDDLGAVIVGAVMKKTVAELLNTDEEKVITNPAISNIYPSQDLTCVSMHNLDQCVVAPEYSDTEDAHFELGIDSRALMSPKKESSSLSTLPDKEPAHVEWNRKIPKPAEEETDADSLLDSDEDYEERDIHFRRNKDKWHRLTTLKGMLAFKEFLKGTQGERYWDLWVDIDKGRLIQDEAEKHKYIMFMREKYYKKGSQFELSAEDRKKLDLESVSSWCPEHFFLVQAKVLEPLLLYWAPRYLLKHLLQTHPEKNYLYNHIKSCTPVKESDPYPHTQSLLPLGPKSCCPRTRPGLGLETSGETEIATRPKTGNRRVYGEDTMARLAHTVTAKYLKLKPPAAPAILQGSPDIRGKKPPSIEDDQASKQIKLSVAEDRDSTSKLIAVDEGIKEVPAKRRSLASTDQAHTSNFIGKLPGIKSSRLSLSAPSPRPPVKTPKDLITPKLKIMDSGKERFKRIQSAPVKKTSSKESTNYIFYRQDSQEAETKEEKRAEAEISEAEFMGSDAMEFLLKALHHEDDAGRSFRKYIDKSERQDWKNLLDFWEKVQTYRRFFYKDKLDLHTISHQARSIFAQFIVDGAPCSIGVSESMELHILEHLKPPFEDLFDEAEEFALKILFKVFQDYLGQDIKSYSKVERIEIMRSLQTKNVNILNLQQKGIIKEGPLTPEDPMEGFVDPVYDSSLLETVPDEFKNWSLDKLLHNRLEMEFFRQHLVDNCAEIDLKCWLDIEAWRRTGPDDPGLRDQRAINIKKQYLNKKYFFGPSSPASKEEQNKVMQVGGGWGKYLEDKPHSNSILEAQKYVRARLEEKHLVTFLTSKEFIERQRPESPEERSEEETMPKKTRSLAVQKVIQHGENEFYKIIEKKQPNYDAFGKMVLPPIQQRTVLSRKTSLGETPPKSEEVKSPERSDISQQYDLVKRTLSQTPIVPEKPPLLESRWVSSTKEIFLFKKTLENPTTCNQFKKFVSIQGDNLENDVLFWLEVQKYKKMHHQHTEDAMIQQKINAILNCFIDSSIPPSLQVDIPQDMADRILERKHEKGPYLFRDAQIATFRVLLQHWGSFREFRSNLTNEEKVAKTLDRHRVIAKQKEMEHREEMARQREKERLRRQEIDEIEAAMALGGFDYEQPEEESDKGDVIQFSYADYLAEQEEEVAKPDDVASTVDSVIISVADRGTQTVRGIPEYDHQPYVERPGFADDFEIDIRAKEYQMEDFVMYKEYLEREHGSTARRPSASHKINLQAINIGKIKEAAPVPKPAPPKGAKKKRGSISKK